MTDEPRWIFRGNILLYLDRDSHWHIARECRVFELKIPSKNGSNSFSPKASLLLQMGTTHCVLSPCIDSKIDVQPPEQIETTIMGNTTSDDSMEGITQENHQIVDDNHSVMFCDTSTNPFCKFILTICPSAFIDKQSPSNSVDLNSSQTTINTFQFTTVGDVQESNTPQDNEQVEHPLTFAKRSIQQISDSSSILDNAFHSRFDIFEFAKLTDRPLLVLGVHLLSESPIFKDLFVQKTVDIQHCASFLDLCERLYQNVPYHNSTHAADVMQFNMFLLSSSFARHHLEDYEILTAMMCAVVHDVGHTGRNNDYLVKTNHELAHKFNKVSCLEQYHIEQVCCKLIES